MPNNVSMIIYNKVALKNKRKNNRTKKISLVRCKKTISLCLLEEKYSNNKITIVEMEKKKKKIKRIILRIGI